MLFHLLFVSGQLSQSVTASLVASLTYFSQNRVRRTGARTSFGLELGLKLVDFVLQIANDVGVLRDVVVDAQNVSGDVGFDVFGSVGILKRI